MKRTKYDDGQLEILRAVYKSCRTPPRDLRMKLARKLNVSARNIQIWFQNQRQRSPSPQQPSQQVPRQDRPAKEEKHTPMGPERFVRPEEYHVGIVAALFTYNYMCALQSTIGNSDECTRIMQYIVNKSAINPVSTAAEICRYQRTNQTSMLQGEPLEKILEIFDDHPPGASARAHRVFGCALGKADEPLA